LGNVRSRPQKGKEKRHTTTEERTRLQDETSFTGEWDRGQPAYLQRSLSYGGVAGTEKVKKVKDSVKALTR